MAMSAICILKNGLQATAKLSGERDRPQRLFRPEIMPQRQTSLPRKRRMLATRLMGPRVQTPG